MMIGRGERWGQVGKRGGLYKGGRRLGGWSLSLGGQVEGGSVKCKEACVAAVLCGFAWM